MQVLLRKLLNDEIKTISRRNLILSRSFAQMLDQSINRYHNRSQVIEELIELAKEMRASYRRGEALGLSDEELAFTTPLR